MHHQSLSALQEAEEELSPIDASAAAQAAAEEAGVLLPEGPAVIASLIVGVHTDFQALVSRSSGCPRAATRCEVLDAAEQQLSQRHTMADPVLSRLLSMTCP